MSPSQLKKQVCNKEELQGPARSLKKYRVRIQLTTHTVQIVRNGNPRIPTPCGWAIIFQENKRLVLPRIKLAILF